MKSSSELSGEMVQMGDVESQKATSPEAEAVVPAELPEPPEQWSQLLLLTTVTVLSLVTWFSASAVLPQLSEIWGITAAEGSLLTITVNFGFAFGATISMVFMISDRLPPARLIFGGAVSAAVWNLLLLTPCGFGGAVVLRTLTGVSLAFVYPPACKVN